MKFDSSVVGLSYRVTEDTMNTMSEVVPLKAELRREPNNTHDENAIAVRLLDKPWRRFHIGYLPRAVAAELAPKLDSGELEISSVTVEAIDTDAGKGEIVIEGRKVKSLQKKVI
jgi:hypothetical protein